MAEDSRGAPREFQLETRHLAMIILMIVVLCITAFMLGRWVERQAFKATALSLAGEDGEKNLSVEEVNKELTYYRTLEEKEDPPAISAGKSPATGKPVELSNISGAVQEENLGASPPAGNSGSVMIQVMATREMNAAIAMRQRLARKGYSVVIVDGAAAGEPGLQRVRVGPYADRPTALKVAKKLEAEEGVRTWIP
jgi:cell division septation protein DedD